MPAPPTEFAWDTPIGDILSTLYDFSDELLDPAKTPRLLLGIDVGRLQVNWQLSGVDEPADQSIIDVSFSARPVAPASIIIKGPLVAPVPTLEALTPVTAPAGSDLSLDIAGTGLDAEPTVNVGNAYGLLPSAKSATALTVLLKASNIFLPGTLPVSVSTRGGQSNALNLTVT